MGPKTGAVESSGGSGDSAEVRELAGRSAKKGEEMGLEEDAERT